MVIRLVSLALLSAVLALGRPDPLEAAPPKTAREQELEERIRRLERIIEERGLDRPVPAAKPTDEAAVPVPKEEVEALIDDKLKKQKVLAGWKDGFFLESPNGDFKLKFRGLVQANARFPFGAGTNPTNSQFFLRRVRPTFEGTVFKYFDWKIMPDFGLGTTTLQDAYMDINYFGPEVKLRAGKTKVPFSLERLQSAQNLLFIERAISQNLAPNRDVGFYLFGDLLDSIVGYQAGVFNGEQDGGSVDGDVNDGKELAARLFGFPFKETDLPYLQGLGVGLAGTYGADDGGNDVTNTNYRTSERVSFFRYRSPSNTTVTAQGNRNRVSPQGYYFWGPFGLQGEYIRSKVGVQWEGNTSGAITQREFDNEGWFVQASYVLTGEDATYGTLVPINNFDPRNGRWGAFEVALRGSKVSIDQDAFTSGFADPDAFPSKTSEITAGVNWYLNKNFKFQLNYSNTEFDRRIEINDELFSGVNSFQMQFQISY